MPLSKAELNAALNDLAKSYANNAVSILGENIVSIALYGSVARVQAGPTSDIDLFVVLKQAPSGMLARRRLLAPVRESLTPNLESLWMQGVYADFVEVIRTVAEARLYHPLYLDMSREAILLHDRDRFLEKLLDNVGERLKREGAVRKTMGRFWYWDLSGLPTPEEVMHQ